MGNVNSEYNNLDTDLSIPRGWGGVGWANPQVYVQNPALPAVFSWDLNLE